MQGSYRRAACAVLALALPCAALVVMPRTGMTAAASASTARMVMILTLHFKDGFEGKRFVGWTMVRTGAGGHALIQDRVAKSGRYAAQLSAMATKGSYAYARKQLPPGQQDVIVGGDFRIAAEGAQRSNVPLFRLFNAAGARMISVYRQNHLHNQVWVQYNNAYHATRGRFPLNAWAHLEVRVAPAGSGKSTLEIRLNNGVIYNAATARLGGTEVRAVQIGDEARRQGFAVVADNIEIRAFRPIATKARR